jgi:aryl-alcohol dehydrogenase-like predicted oxidoreductase
VNKVQLGNSGVQVSALALGTDLFGTKIDRDTCFSLLDYFADRGGTFLDTANFYASWLPGCKGGESETTIGEWIKARGNRDRVAIATKLAFDYPGCSGGLSAGEIQRECEKSLRRLQTDRIDLYYSHRDDRETPLAETMEAFHQLVKAGKVRAVGASNLRVWRIAEANAISSANGWTGYSAVEQRYTYLRPRHGADFGPQLVIGDEMKDFAQSSGVTLIGYSVLLRGAYTRSDRELPVQFAGPEAEERLKALRQVAAEAGCTPNQVIIAWMRQSVPAVLPIIAASRRQNLEENIAALDVVLSDEQMERLNSAGNSDLKQGWIQST